MGCNYLAVSENISWVAFEDWSCRDIFCFTSQPWSHFCWNMKVTFIVNELCTSSHHGNTNPFFKRLLQSQLICVIVHIHNCLAS